MLVQGDPKLTPPLPGKNEKNVLKTEYSIFKYNLFKNLPHVFALSGQVQDPFFGNMRKSPFLPNFAPILPKFLP